MATSLKASLDLYTQDVLTLDTVLSSVCRTLRSTLPLGIELLCFLHNPFPVLFASLGVLLGYSFALGFRATLILLPLLDFTYYPDPCMKIQLLFLGLKNPSPRVGVGVHEVKLQLGMSTSHVRVPRTEPCLCFCTSFLLTRNR